MVKKTSDKELYYCDICDKLIGDEPWVCHDCNGEVCKDHINKKESKAVLGIHILEARFILSAL